MTLLDEMKLVSLNISDFERKFTIFQTMGDDDHDFAGGDETSLT